MHVELQDGQGRSVVQRGGIGTRDQTRDQDWPRRIPRVEIDETSVGR
jgi:hypothetical protein